MEKPTTRIYSVQNRAKYGMWIFATDEQDARDQAVTLGHVRSADGITSVDDETERRLKNDVEMGLDDTARIMAAGLRGPATRSIPMIMGNDLIAGLLTGREPVQTGGHGWNEHALA